MAWPGFPQNYRGYGPIKRDFCLKHEKWEKKMLLAQFLLTAVLRYQSCIIIKQWQIIECKIVTVLKCWVGLQANFSVDYFVWPMNDAINIKMALGKKKVANPCRQTLPFSQKGKTFCVHSFPPEDTLVWLNINISLRV